jgi:hypothetical protein
MMGPASFTVGSWLIASKILVRQALEVAAELLETAGEHVDGVGAERLDLRENVILKAAAHGHHEHDRRDADDDAEHREERAAFVGRESRGCRQDEVLGEHYS